MKTANITIVTLILLIANAWIGLAQSNVQVKTQNGLTTTTFTTSSGTVQVYLPNISGSQTISGTIKTLPKGDSKRKQEKNLKALQKLKLNLGNTAISLQSNQFTIPTIAERITLRLNDNNSEQVTTINLNETINSCASTCIPSYMVAGSPAPISSALLDGNLGNTSIMLGSTKTNILAESKNHVFFEVPNNLSGQERLSFSETDTTIQETVNVLQLNLSAEQLSLRRSETTTLTITVSGLEGLQSDVPLSITNNSPSNILLEGGNNQEISISPNVNNFSQRFIVKAIQNGGFSITAQILPSTETIHETNDELLCNCIIDNYSYLINPEACKQLGGDCYDDVNQLIEPLQTTSKNNYPDFYLNYAVYFSYDSDIDHLKGDIFDKWKEYDEVKKKKDSLSELHNDLVGIDKILDRVPKTYMDDLKRIVDSLQNLKKELPDNADSSTLQKVVDEAQAAVDTCKKRIADLVKEQQELEEQLEKEKEDLIKTLEELKNILRDYNIKLDYTFNEDGSLNYTKDTSGMYEYDKEKINDEGDLISGLEKELRTKNKQYKKTLKRLKEIPQQLEDAEKDCKDLEDAFGKAKQAKATSDLVAATELKADAICDEIQRLLARLKHWCIQHPEHCDFLDDIEAMMENCPKTTAELDDFWNDFDALLKKKKVLEDSLARAAQDSQDELDKIEDDVSDLENEIAGIAEEKRQKAQEEEEQKQKIAQAEAEEAAKAVADAAERKKKRDQQKKDDDKVKDLIKKAKSDEAGDDAFEDLITGLGLDRLDDVTGNLKLGKLIGGLLVIKGQPDCVCPLLSALLSAIKAKKDGGYIGLHVEAYIQAWNECANLSNIVASVSLGGSELTEAINGMTKDQVDKALEALNQAVRIQCE